ncbi:hypothetical protein Rumeso_04851 [Rubellimicrobium mesophilum DSM 19309]|uniref:Uncharacterized protein n=1 Tax=Rubellimicrobium mesophilum DSM 19309 TaxID=442562 RepID=A0A017HEC2_9RHOB|nr:hypothetical protein [Rubellimicrobium mesophilum]EYD72124.1 hypothetical protein Rumeso_04851 [Rubellimicrobium mesophilum DSM 19309]
MEDDRLPEGGVNRPLSIAAHADRQPALALHMGLPGTRLDIVLGGPHPLLVEVVRAMARVAAQADHAAVPTGMASGPAIKTED